MKDALGLGLKLLVVPNCTQVCLSETPDILDVRLFFEI